MVDRSNPKYTHQINAFDFLNSRYHSQELFSKEELRQGAGWEKGTFDTYWTKQLKQLLIEVGRDSYRVSESFSRVSNESKFLDHVSQVRVVASDYKHETFDVVLRFEFFMPLSHEGYLRSVLDDLFYKDSIIRRLKSLPVSELQERIEKIPGEDRLAYLDRSALIAGGYFGGYSISHVQGRYRGAALKSKTEAAQLNIAGEKYLIDETTAIARFIIPCADVPTASKVRWLFMRLFAEGVIQTVNGEEEVWMLESGVENKLHVWSIDRS